MRHLKAFENFQEPEEFTGKKITLDFEKSDDKDAMKLGHPGQSITATIGGIDPEEKKVILRNEKGNHVFTIKYFGHDEVNNPSEVGYYEFYNLGKIKLSKVKEAYQGNTLDNIVTKYRWQR